MPFPTTVDTIVDAPPFSANTLGHASQVLGPQRITVGPVWVNVKSDQYGALGDGVTDDTAACQAAVAAANAAGATVYFPPGTYIINCNATLANFATVVGLPISSGVSIVGAGRAATTLKMKANQVNGVSGGSSITTSPTLIASAVASDVTIRDLAIDGNGASQSATAGTDGIVFYQVQRGQIVRVAARNFFTPAASEQAVIGLLSSTKCSVEAVNVDEGGFNCNAIALSGCTQCEVRGCTGTGTAVWRTFVCDGCALCSWVDNWAYLWTAPNVAFDCTRSTNIGYVRCIAGGLANPQWQGFAAPFPYSFSQNLGNANASAIGFNIADNAGLGGVDIELVDCVANNIGGAGLQQQSLIGPVRVVGGDYSGNGIGFNFPNATSATVTRITGGPRASGNTNAMRLGATNYASIFGAVTDPAIPTLGVALTNPFPFDANVWIKGNATTASTISVGGTVVADVGVADGGSRIIVPVAATQSITITNNQIQAWHWWIA